MAWSRSHRVFASLALSTTLLLALLLVLAPGALGAEQGGGQQAIVVYATGMVSTVDEPMKEYVVDEGLREAEARGVPLIVVLDTNGGYLDAAWSIGDAFLEAKVPVIGFVKSKALSAGIIILLPMHVVALTPYAIVGASQPIIYNPATGTVQFVNESKIVNPVAEKAVSYARARGRNTTAARLFVVRNLVLTGEEAVQAGVADLVAVSLDDLIAKINGRTVRLLDGRNYTIRISGYVVLRPSIRVYTLAVLRDPVINSILVMLGMFGTLFALLSARLEILPLTITLLIVALIGSGFNINMLALLLIVIGSIMLFVELFITPGFGILGISGIIAMTFGLLLAPFRGGVVGFAAQYLETLRMFALGLGGFFGVLGGVITYKVIESRRRGPRMPYSPEEKKVGKAVDRIEPGKQGFVVVEGEYWLAESSEVIEPGDQVEVVGRKDHVLIVRKVRSGGGDDGSIS